VFRTPLWRSFPRALNSGRLSGFCPWTPGCVSPPAPPGCGSARRSAQDFSHHLFSNLSGHSLCGDINLIVSHGVHCDRRYLTHPGSEREDVGDCRYLPNDGNKAGDFFERNVRGHVDQGPDRIFADLSNFPSERGYY